MDTYPQREKRKRGTGDEYHPRNVSPKINVVAKISVPYGQKVRVLSLLSCLMSIKMIIFYIMFQFAQFALLTQAFAVFGTYTMQYINSKALRAVILGQTVSSANFSAFPMYFVISIFI